MSPSKSPKDVLADFYDAERHYMQVGGSRGGASFDAMAATLAADVVLHQSPDLPFGGEYVGHQRYQAWADAMSAIFDRVDAREPEFFEKGDTIVIVCTLATRVRATGREMKQPMVQIVTVKNGLITEFRPFYWNVSEYFAAAQARS